MAEQSTGRKLKITERELLERVFNGAVNYDLIRIFDTDPDDPQRTRSYHSENMIYLLGGDYADDISKGTMKQKGTLVHEVAHAWQFQKTAYCSGQEEQDAHFKQKAYDAWHEHAIMVQRQIEAAILDWSDQLKDEMERAPRTQLPAVKAALRQYHSSVLQKLYNKRDSLKGVESRARARIATDKASYLSQEAYDPILTTVGPLDEFESRQSHVNGAFGKSNAGPPSLSFANAKPLPNERLSDFMWRQAEIKEAFGTKSNLRLYLECNAHEEDGSNASFLDYNYMLKKPGTVGFFDLRVEAQAQLITEYFFLKNGVDPRTVWYDDLNTRPPLSFYEKTIPFLATPVKM